MFVNPWIPWMAVAAAALPVAVHFLTRPKPVRLPLSTLRFVQDAVASRRTRHRLRDAIILALRTLAVLLAGFAVARPFFGRSDARSAEAAASVVRVVVLDVSQSMAAVDQGVQVFERARPLAAR